MRPLSKREKYLIHLSALDLLREVGVKIPHEETLKRLEDAGAYVDYKGQRALIPQHLSEEAIKKTPHRFSVYCKDLKTRKILGEDKVYFGTVGFATNFYDASSMKYRKLTAQDLVMATRVADALENVELYMCMGSPADVPLDIVDRYMWAISLTNITKPVICEAYWREGALDAFEMASSIVGGIEELKKKPIIILLTCITSPFMYDIKTLEALVEAYKLGIPTLVDSGPVAGGTSPVTMAGTLVQNIAEVISAVVIRYVYNKDAPIIIASWARTLDMRTGSAVLGGPEFALLHAYFADMARYYEIPSAGGGILTDSKALDAQMGYEKAITALFPAVAGLNLICGMGLIGSENAVSPECLVIDNEIVGAVKRTTRAIEITDETLALDVIEKVGPGGCFIREKHTIEHFKRELWIPRISDRSFISAWVSLGAKEMWMRAKEEVERILKEHAVPQLPKDVLEKIEGIIKRRQK